MKVLLTGSKGQLGSCFCDRLPAGWDVLATDSDSLDITDLARVKQVVADYRPDAIVNAAAYTAVDKAETESELAARINEQGPKNLAQAAAEAGCRLIHVSTDYVFDGQAKMPYREADVTNPLGVYGKTKLDGEIAVAAAHPEAIIIRTAWVFSEYGNNFVKTMLRLAKDRDVLGIVADQRGCPTYAGDIAQAIIDLLQRRAEGGVYHFCGDKEVSWSEFAEAIFAAAMAQGLLEKSPQVNGITTEQYPTPAKRPAYSSLDCEKIERLGISRSNWVSALENTLKVAAV
ncbi:dTDP-4-dehydrorhamnose reductase [Serratia entomophila]|uniref:dTDP-4-dehydrorhamnose reductase n=4 Tax=Serratia entomophila TaxID=42906 RepID=UPI00217B0AA6|nr:dTDP-4-dehydrorhamnose reductase [Serratia entomophila]CAI0690772.1 dTDP-4-dehydrorhamnose reductase [Serratia entomophila]CAI0883658.1 dTDP-4-dehydrorhamnose reductase [Serratia entomophila]CAI1707485.1 dTDP-4-dehydrorhamnose reductase [Serratia entomophila]CAI1738163.1 dTDP-4-dehydrorhamnose reductase [Serratia entomophila]CAI2001537.1 dTDP-4-dehydrorhamnose reductase [Serratia entomophila]